MAIVKDIEDSPFIIWTFRRTGGTNLGQALFAASSFDQVEHEPFNGDRIFGDVTRRFKESGDISVLRQDVESILKKKPLIKHCLEIIPQELNLVLAELSVKYGYKSVFLYREYAKDRLLSLNYAQMTGVWGKEHKKKLDDSTDVFKKPFPVKEMINHEYLCRQKMDGVFRFLISQNISPIILSFEALYKSESYEYSCSLVRDLFQKLDLGVNSVTKEFLNKTLKRGGQGTKSDYLKFPKASDFLTEVKKLAKYSLQSEGIIDVQINTDNLKYKHLECWPVLSGLLMGEYYISGVLLPEDTSSVRFSSGGKNIPVNVGLPSPRIEKKYPDLPGSGSCRFLLGPVLIKDRLEIFVEALD